MFCLSNSLLDQVFGSAGGLLDLLLSGRGLIRWSVGLLVCWMRWSDVGGILIRWSVGSDYLQSGGLLDLVT